MLTVKHNHAKPPNGGHRFPNGDEFHRGDTVEEVLEKMEAHRAENALPLGNPEQDLAKYYQSIAPYLVRDEPDKEFVAPRSQIAAESMMTLWREHPDLYLQTNARIALREKTCDECPMKRRYPKDGNSEKFYQRRAKQRASLLTGKREIEKEGWCHWCKLPIPLAVLIREPQKWERLQSPPKSCWVKEI